MSNAIALRSAKPLNAGISAKDMKDFYEFANGSFRIVLDSDKFDGVVVKKSNDSSDHDQIREVETWAAMVKDGYGHLVPAHDVIYVEGRLFLVVEFIEFTFESRLLDNDTCMELSFASEYTSDVQPGSNFGQTEDGRFILRDAGTSFEADDELYCSDFDFNF